MSRVVYNYYVILYISHDVPCVCIIILIRVLTRAGISLQPDVNKDVYVNARDFFSVEALIRILARKYWSLREARSEDIYFHLVRRIIAHLSRWQLLSEVCDNTMRSVYPV